MTGLPNGDRAVVEIRKLENYCLDSFHPRGRHKARVFNSALSLGPRDASWLRSVLLDAARNGEAVELASDSYGARWSLDILVSRQGRRALIRSIWIIKTGDLEPRFVTCWIV
jgi:hypothetical protein